MRRSLAVTLIAVTAVTACKTDRAPATDTTARTAAGQPTKAAPVHDAVIITSPAKGATTGTDVTVTMRATGVTIAKADGSQTTFPLNIRKDRPYRHRRLHVHVQGIGAGPAPDHRGDRLRQSCADAGRS